MEVTQFTYFQQVGGLECRPVPSEITYGIERLAMYIQGVDSVYDLVWAISDDGTVFTYGDVFLENEREFSAYNFEYADVDMLLRHFEDYEKACHDLLEQDLPLPAYDCVLKCSHTFNLLDARGAISATERMGYILRVRTVAKACCVAYSEHMARLEQGVPPRSPPFLPRKGSTMSENSAALLFEIGTEEIPAFALVSATSQLATLATKALDDARIPHGEVTTMSTPRRITLMVADVASSSTPSRNVPRAPPWP